MSGAAKIRVSPTAYCALRYLAERPHRRLIVLIHTDSGVEFSAYYLTGFTGWHATTVPLPVMRTMRRQGLIEVAEDGQTSTNLTHAEYRITDAGRQASEPGSSSTGGRGR